MDTLKGRLIFRFIPVLMLHLILCGSYVEGSSDQNAVEFKCDTHGYITSVTKSGTKPENILVLKQNQKYCHFSSDCGSETVNKTKLQILITRDDDKDVLAGNKNVYQLECKDEYKGVSATAAPFAVQNIATAIPKAVTYKKAPVLELSILQDSQPINGKQLTIGDTLTLKCSLNDNSYKIYPQSCVAKNPENTDESLEIWKFNSTNSENCSTFDGAVIGQKWTREQTGGLKINLSAFRFISGTKVEIMCTANLCKNDKSLLAKTCAVDSVKRRRRSIRNGTEESDDITGYAYAEFSVADYFSETFNKAYGPSYNLPLLVGVFLFIRHLTTLI